MPWDLNPLSCLSLQTALFTDKEQIYFEPQNAEGEPRADAIYSLGFRTYTFTICSVRSIRHSELNSSEPQGAQLFFFFFFHSLRFLLCLVQIAERGEPRLFGITSHDRLKELFKIRDHGRWLDLTATADQRRQDLHNTNTTTRINHRFRGSRHAIGGWGKRSKYVLLL